MPGSDFAGPVGAPIYAAARGTVSFAGQRNGYGNCVEIDHGNGLVTRYAHMSRLRAHVGEKVAAGAVIGALGQHRPVDGSAPPFRGSRPRSAGQPAPVPSRR